MTIASTTKILSTLLLCNAYVSITHLRTRERINMLTVIPHSYSQPCRSYTDSLHRPQIMHHAHPLIPLPSHSPLSQLAPSTVSPTSTPSSPREPASPLCRSSRRLKHVMTPSTQRIAPFSFTIFIQHNHPHIKPTLKRRMSNEDHVSSRTT